MPQKYNALIVDDEPDILELLAITLGRMDISTQTASNIASAKQLLNTHQFDFCLTDLRLPDGSGIEFVTHIQQVQPTLPTAVITAFGSMDTAIEALKAGAFDFVSKPVNLNSLRDLVQNALKVNKEQNLSENETAQSFPSLLGNAPVMVTLRNQIKKLARSQAPIYISGESGSGKELAARMIHQLGPRSNEPFVPVNCGAIPAELVESELFGHRKGSFTGATAHKTGLFQAAHGGTLFLDEVADLPIDMQVKLLRAVQEKTIRPVGSETEIPVNVRILSATHKNLENEVKEERFRQDLYYRINVIELQVPPLRERQEDIPLLAEHILTRLSEESDLSKPTIQLSAMQALQQHAFPGNVRELENLLERAFTLCEDDVIRLEDLRLNASAQLNSPDLHTESTAVLSSGGNTGTSGETSDPSLNSTSTTAGGKHPDLSLAPGETLEDYLLDIERKMINKALESTRWNKTAAAKQLGISFRALRYRLKKLGLE